VRAPKNLTIIVWDNGIYQITGSQPTATTAADLVGIARASGIAKAHWAADEEDFGERVKEALSGGPSLIAARIDNQPGLGEVDRDPVRIRQNFMDGLGLR
jgi:thiamine pyrophosphate-dependent acetolactate synthase large subunit-like protein